MIRDRIRTYTELVSLPTFEERVEYLKLDGQVGLSTFGFTRFLNQEFYHSREWKQVRDMVFVRDMGCDLACEDRVIVGRYLVHHMNPIDVDDIEHSSDFLLNPEYLITTTDDTHNFIHYGNRDLRAPSPFVERQPYDTCPWRQNKRRN